MPRRRLWVGCLVFAAAALAGATGACVSEDECEYEIGYFYINDEPPEAEVLAAVMDECAEANYPCCVALCTEELRVHDIHELNGIDLCELEPRGEPGVADDILHCEGTDKYKLCDD